MAKYDALNMRMSTVHKKQLKALAAHFNVPMSTVIETLIDKAHSNLEKETARDRAEPTTAAD